MLNLVLNCVFHFLNFRFNIFGLCANVYWSNKRDLEPHDLSYESNDIAKLSEQIVP